MKINFKDKIITFVALVILIILIVLVFAVYFLILSDRPFYDNNIEEKEEFFPLDFSLEERQKELLVNWMKENSEIAVQQEIIICQDDFYIPPLLYREIAETIEEGLNIKIQYYHVPWVRIIPALEEGRCDAIFELTPLEERKGAILFSQPVYPDRSQAIAVSKDNYALLEMFNSIIAELNLIIKE